MVIINGRRQVIETKYLGPTDHRGGRVKAYAEAGSVTISWDHGIDTWDNHVSAVIALMDKMGWNYGYIGGSKADNSGYVFVCTDD